MIEVTLIDCCAVHPLAKAEHAAKTCYQGAIPDIGTGKDASAAKFVKEKLFSTGHHTTLQHSLFSFQVEGIAVGNVTFGLHLVSPFYNSDQRSGRFCSDMFLNPDFERIGEYVQYFWPDERSGSIERAMSYLRHSVGVYVDNLERAAVVAEIMLREERKFAGKTVLGNARKIAQEQLRNLIPVVFPTGLVYTVVGSALVALWESAWDPVMRRVTDLMRVAVLREYPEASFLFDPDRRRSKDRDWNPRIPEGPIGLLEEPALALLDIAHQELFTMPATRDMHPVDRLHFLPELMNNSMGRIVTRVGLSVATMGQDQRHRTVSRSEPVFLPSFYVPPIMKELGLHSEAEDILSRWLELDVSSTLKTIMAPYGAMVSYEKSGSFNAVLHEQEKRLCFSAQQEIYNNNLQLREAIGAGNPESPLLGMFEPPCYRTGKCAEGARYCGRDISRRESAEYFPVRKV
ncbi:MAG: hypothetical protein HGA31_01575 [Candidatus Moranbacteria bacterium]|nr:hypothetical protein [Candidatus Moranbacteria bacterium]